MVSWGNFTEPVLESTRGSKDDCRISRLAQETITKVKNFSLDSTTAGFANLTEPSRSKGSSMHHFGIFKFVGRLAIASVALSILIVGSHALTPAAADIRASFRFNGAARQCADLLAPCLSLSSEQRSSCLFEVSLDSHCEGSELGGLAFRRWSYESTGEGENVQSDALSISENRVDFSCIERFDRGLEQTLKNSHVSSSEIFQFSSALDRCRMKPQNPELLRP